MKRWLALLAIGGISLAPAAQVPDLSGWWTIRLTPPPPLIRMLAKPPALKPGRLDELLRALGSLIKGEVVLDYCRPNEVGGFLNGTGFEDTLEFLFTRDRITLTSEIGLLRRVYMAGQTPQDGPVESPTGFSTGTWDGDTLVIETRFLSPTNRYPVPVAGAPPIGKNARVVERVRLLDAGTLEIRYTLFAPELADSPLENTAIYERIRNRVGQFADFCPLDDRLVDISKGVTQFDTRPPPDLPPPR
jgi:hypothetical protein